MAFTSSLCPGTGTFLPGMSIKVSGDGLHGKVGWGICMCCMIKKSLIICKGEKRGGRGNSREWVHPVLC